MIAIIFAIIHVGMALAALLLGVFLFLLFKEVTKGK
jgi:hypothetical protein